MNSFAKLSLQFIEDRIGELERADLKLACIDDLKRRLVDLIRPYASRTMIIDADKSIFRVRKHSEHVMLTSVDEIYPSADYMSPLNRASRKGQPPIFYFSTWWVTALNEVRAASGDTCTIIECKPRHGASPLLIPVGIHSMARRQNIRIGGVPPAPWWRTKDEFHKYKLIDDFVATQFLKVVDDHRQQEYKLSIAIAELLFEFGTDESPIDGIAYPSIADQTGANVAILPLAFHRIYRAVACTRVKIVEAIVEGHGFKFGERKAKQIADLGKIVW